MRLHFCVACGHTGADLNDHHMVPRSLGGTDDENNLITLCRPCHGKAHSVSWEMGHAELVRRGTAKAKKRGGPTRDQVRRREARAARLLGNGRSPAFVAREASISEQRARQRGVAVLRRERLTADRFSEIRWTKAGS